MSVNVPIRSVTPANAKGEATGTAITNLPAPSKSDWAKADLSAPDAGRTVTGRMLKKRQGKTDRLELEWQFPTRTEAAMVLQVFDNEYTLVEYLDARAGTWITKHFYSGDMQASGWLPQVDSWRSIALSIIQATPSPG